jgi:hypothetical protein
MNIIKNINILNNLFDFDFTFFFIILFLLLFSWILINFYINPIFIQKFKREFFFQFNNNFFKLLVEYSTNKINNLIKYMNKKYIQEKKNVQSIKNYFKQKIIIEQKIFEIIILKIKIKFLKELIQKFIKLFYFYRKYFIIK